MSRRFMVRRFVIAGAVVGALIAAGALLANVGPTATLATGTLPAGSSHVATNPLANGAGSTTPGASGRFGWGWGGRSGHRGFGRVLTAKSVSGNTITATGRGGQAVTVQVSATTAYTEAGASASLADIHTGSLIVARGSVSGTSATTINATAITILLPAEAGVVTSVSGNTITLTGFNGVSHTVVVTGQTRYQKAGTSASLSDVTAGTAIVAEGTLDSSGTLTAVRVTIRVPTVAGRVTAVNGSSYTVMGRFGTSFGTTYTVSATSSTTYVNPNGTAASASAVKVGTYIAAQGTLSGNTLTAQRVIVVPAGAGRGFGYRGHGVGRDGPGFGRGGPGFGPGPAGAGSAGTTAPTTPATQNV